jgi:tight adherence protein C
VLLGISALAFLAASLLVVAGFPARLASPSRRIDAYLRPPDPGGSSRPDLGPGFAERVAAPALAALGRVVVRLTPAGVMKKLRARLDMAGNPRFPGSLQYLGLRLLSPLVVIPVGVFALARFDLPWVVGVLALAIIVGVGIWLPDIALQRIIEGRQAAIRRSLADAVDLLVISVEAGVGLEGAIRQVVGRSRGPLAEELERVLEQVRLGRSRGDALREMGQRTQVPELMSFVAAIQQGETMGVSIGKVLRTQAEAIRQRRSERTRETAAKLPVKLLFPLVIFVFPALFVVILGPAAIRFAQLFKVLGK